ncbi:hypothetical protein V8E53_013882 [Lactarius tabidus]
MGQVGVVLAAIGLFWLAFTTYRGVHWIVPILTTFPSHLDASCWSWCPRSRDLRSCVPGRVCIRIGTVSTTALLAGLMTLAIFTFQASARLLEFEVECKVMITAHVLLAPPCTCVPDAFMSCPECLTRSAIARSPVGANRREQRTHLALCAALDVGVVWAVAVFDEVEMRIVDR